MKNNFLSNYDMNLSEISALFDLAKRIKNNEINLNVGNKVLGLIFDKASTRTRVSFQVAMSRLGGSTIDLNPSTTQIGRGEPIKDTARVLSKYCDILAVRTYSQADVEEYAKWSSKPIINALTDLEHPCQALADFLTIKEEFKTFNNIKIAYFGDGNNVANSLILCGSILNLNVNIACPKGFEPNSQIIKKAETVNNQSKIFITEDPYEAAEGANVLYTDVWSSMGQESESETKDEIFKNYQLNKDLVSKAEENAIVLHCLPAYRGKEITNEVFESPTSRIFNQAENRLHVQQALLAHFLKK